MKTRHQIKQRRAYNNYIRKLKYDSWVWGKRLYGSSRHNCYSIKNANIVSTPHADVAIKDIQIGEELLCDYYGFDDTYFRRQGINKEDLID